MIRTTPSNLWDEIEAGKEYVSRRLQQRRDLIDKYIGPHWGSNQSDRAGNQVENHPYEYISLVLPQIVYNNPQVTVASRRTTPIHRIVSSALQDALNRWIKDQRLSDMLRQVCFDYLTAWGVTLTTYEENRNIKLPRSMSRKLGYTNPMWPVCRRISPEDFFFDHRATEPTSRRWEAHRRLYDLEDLRVMAEENEDGTWDVQAVNALKSDAPHPEDGREGEYGPDREQIYVYEMWIPEDTADNDDNEHGTIYTLVKGPTESEADDIKFIRKPRPFYGPETGPYTTFGAFYVSDEAAELSPLLATMQQQEEADEFAAAFSRGARDYKNLFLTSDKKLAEKVINEPHNTVHVMDSVMYGSDGKPNFAAVAVGGATREQMEGVVQAQRRLERVTGLSDAMRGQTSTGDTTATEEQIAYQGGSIRVDELRQKFLGCLTRMLHGVGWLMFTDSDFMIPLSGDDFGRDDFWFEGGADSGVVELVGMSYSDLEAHIEPYSMERISDSSRMARLGAAAERAVALGQVMAQMPWLNWEEIVQDVGNAYNMPDYASRFNWPVLQQMWEQGGMAVESPGTASGAKIASVAPPGTQSVRVTQPSMMPGDEPSGRSAGQVARRDAPDAV